ncbi:hypothetical protein JZ751_025815, partial [Albula glossodonta]
MSPAEKAGYSRGMLEMLPRHCCSVQAETLYYRTLQFELERWAVDGKVTRCSSILLACERMIRLKKSSSGTVGPLAAGGG